MKKNIAEIPEWFQGSRLNYAENLLRHNNDQIAIYSAGLFSYLKNFYSLFTRAAFSFTHPQLPISFFLYINTYAHLHTENHSWKNVKCFKMP